LKATNGFIIGFLRPPPRCIQILYIYIFAEYRVDNGYAARRTNDARTRRYGTRPRRAGHEAAPSLHPPRAVRSRAGRARLPARPLHTRPCRGGLPGGKPFTLALSRSVADPDRGSGIRCLFDPWIRDPEWVFPDPGSQTHFFESLVTIFWVKSSIIL
jgi:hypothetical protein